MVKRYIILFIVLFICLSFCSKDQNNTGDDIPTVPEFSKRILMLGRSVMGGWFVHWGNSNYASKNRYELFYGEMNSPPDIVNSANGIINQRNIDATWAVFFKFCFVDFDVYDQNEANQKLNELKNYVEQIRQEVRTKRNAYLIIATALPEVYSNTNQYIKWLHQQYNEWVKQLASSDSRIKIFDMYSILVDSNGSLKSNYASGPDDAHLNHAAYNALDQQFFPFLNANVKIFN